MRRHGIGEIPCRGASHNFETQLTSFGKRDGYHPVLKGTGRVGRIVLYPERLQPQFGAEPTCPHKRGETGSHGQIVISQHRKEWPVSPDATRTCLSGLPADSLLYTIVIVVHFEWPETKVAYMQRLRGIEPSALPALQTIYAIHSNLLIIGRALAPGLPS